MGNKTAQEKLQKFGRFLSGMVMPNIGAFIAWGLITALFIPTGWIPNANLAKLVGPMITYLLPLLIGFTGGKMVGGNRGGVLGAIATMGVVVGASVPMFLGAMIMGPLGGFCIKKFDDAVDGKIPAGFEMLVNNFSAGIIGLIVALLGYLAIGPVVQGITAFLSAGVQAIINAGLLPLVSIFIEPAKVLFLNNAVNHGILAPIGLQQAKTAGKSIMFLLEPNPGPGLGILLAYWVFAKGAIKQSAPGAIIIHFFGGIHEIYFPYVLMNPILILAVMAGGVSGVFMFSILGAGLVATPSPGSIFAVLAMTPKGGYIPVLTGVIVSTVVSFLVASFFVKRSSSKMDDSDLEDAKEKVQELKGKSPKKNVKAIIFACDAGMGSSAMGATTLKNKLKKAGINIEVTHCAVDDVPADAEIVISHESLAARARAAAPKAEYIPVKDFIQNNAFERVMEILDFQPSKAEENQVEEKTVEVEEDTNEILRKSNIKLGLKSSYKFEAIRMAGRLLVEGGYVMEEYIEAMVEREHDLSTYIGKGIAIPHGIGPAKSKILKSGMVVLQFPDGVMFDNEMAYLLVGIAGVGDEHLSILSNLATIIEDADDAMLEKLRNTKDVDYIHKLFTK